METHIYEHEARTFTDEVSGRPIRQLTRYRGHSSVLYFTDDYWLVPNEVCFFVSDRCGTCNVYLYDLRSDAIQQVTFFSSGHTPGGLFWKDRGTFCGWYGNELFEIEIRIGSNGLPVAGRVRMVLSLEPEYEHTGLHALGSDARSVYTAIRPRQANSIPTSVYNKSPDYLTRFREARESHVIRIDVESGRREIVHTEHRFIEHVNSSSVHPGLLTFCHEGPWAKVDQRIWGLDLASGQTWPIRPQENDAAIGHEYMINGGEWIGYHGRTLPGEQEHFFGMVRPDNSERFEHRFPWHCTHFTSYGTDTFLGDGTPANVQPWFPSNQKPYLMLFTRSGTAKDGTPEYDGPRVLAFHRATFNEQVNHPHAAFTPDGRHVLYTSDMGGYSNLYLVKVGDPAELPTVADVSVEWS